MVSVPRDQIPARRSSRRRSGLNGSGGLPTADSSIPSAANAPGDDLDPVGLRITPIQIGERRKRFDISRQREQDEYFKLNNLFEGIIDPPHALSTLHAIFTSSNVLRQCVDSYVVNINCYGFNVVPINDRTEMDPKEKELLERWVEQPNPGMSLIDIRSKFVFEYEKYGFSFYEIIRNRQGRPTLLKHARASQIRILARSEVVVRVTTEMYRNGRRSRVSERRRFRRYQQIREGSQAAVFYKEFGDPRKMSYVTGEYESDDYKVPFDEEATEILHMGLHSEEPYGEPRWISQLPNILGSRESEEVNLRYFEDNTVPPALLTIAGGRLTHESFSTLQDVLRQTGVGRERQHQILVVEAIPLTDGLEDKGNVSIKLDKLTDARQSDALFKGYDDSNRGKIISVFRLPPILIGDTTDSNYANAQIALSMAETQVFYPERKSHDGFLNNNFFNHPRGLNLKTVRVESKGPIMTSPEQVVRTLTALNVMGGLTPITAIKAINELMDLNLEELPERGQAGFEDWMDQPIMLSLKVASAPSLSENSQDEQRGKPVDIKALEQDGDTSDRQPENERKGEPALPSFNTSV